MQYNLPEDIADIIRDLQKRVEQLEKGGRVGATSIDNGALQILKDGGMIANFGDMSLSGIGNIDRPDGTPQMGILLRRDTGELVFLLGDTDPVGSGGYQQFWSWWDRNGRIISADDTDSGHGLARPYIPTGMWFSSRVNEWPASVSAAFEGMWETWYHVQHIKLYMQFLVFCDAGTVGEAKFFINGVESGTPSPTPCPAGSFTYFDQVLTLPSALMHTTIQMQIQVRRVSGTGNVRVIPRTIYGRQS